MADDSSNASQWSAAPDDDGWPSPEVSDEILGKAGGPVPLGWVQTCAGRVLTLRDDLRRSWVGLENEDLGPFVDWIIAALIARENVLLLGPPGVAKNEVAVRLFKLLGLRRPVIDEDLLRQPMPEDNPRQWWLERVKKGRRVQKYFQFLLSRFTQPEHLFGPIEISLLRKGMLVRVNFGFMTGPGVRAVFADEVFKASGSILNTLLTLLQERQYFNWGAMERSDLVFVVGASNEMPGIFGAGGAGVASRGEDFAVLYAFVDRFPLRLIFPVPSGTSRPAGDDGDAPGDAPGGDAAPPRVPDPVGSDLGKAFRKASDREARAMVLGETRRFEAQCDERLCINDILLLGRAVMQQKAMSNAPALFEAGQLRDTEETLLRVGADLLQWGTDVGRGRITWTISPRKLKAVHKIALAHALIVDDGFAHARRPRPVPIRPEDLHGFYQIWDTPVAAYDLAERARANIHR